MTLSLIFWSVACARCGASSARSQSPRSSAVLRSSGLRRGGQSDEDHLPPSVAGPSDTDPREGRPRLQRRTRQSVRRGDGQVPGEIAAAGRRQLSPVWIGDSSLPAVLVLRVGVSVASLSLQAVVRRCFRHHQHHRCRYCTRRSLSRQPTHWRKNVYAGCTT